MNIDNKVLPTLLKRLFTFAPPGFAYLLVLAAFLISFTLLANCDLGSSPRSSEMAVNNAATSAPPSQGSVLVFPYYTSGNGDDTTIYISNTGNQGVSLHVFFLESPVCDTADAFITIAANRCFTMTASNWDPNTTGLLLFVAIDDLGTPVQYNSFSGYAYLKTSTFDGVYQAEAFQAHTAHPATLNVVTASLNFDGVNYDKVAGEFAIDVQSPLDAPGQMLVTAGMKGAIGANTMSGAAQVGAGSITNKRTLQSDSVTGFLAGSCFSTSTITSNNPRIAIAGGVAALLPSGDTGLLDLTIGGGVGLLLTPKGVPGAGIVPLKKKTLVNASFDIPVFLHFGFPGGSPIGAIAIQPQNTTVLKGDKATFTISAPGSTAIQWQMSTNGGATFVNLSGQTNATLIISPATVAQSGNLFRAIVTFDCNVEISDPATLTVSTVLPGNVLVAKLHGNSPAQIKDPATCLDPGSVLAIDASLTNPNLNPLQSSFIASMPNGLTAIAGSCITDLNQGTCTVSADGSSVSWTGTLQPKQTINLFYRTRIGVGLSYGTQLCINNFGDVGGATGKLQYCFDLTCTGSSRLAQPQPGSVLVFPYYTSSASGGSDTRITITSAGDPANSLVPVNSYVHLFFLDGSNCQQADMYICLTPSASISMKTLELDPGVTGWLLAVAVDQTGLAVRNNVLIGNAFVNEGRLQNNYEAVAFRAKSDLLAALVGNSATLFFDGIGYEQPPKSFAVEVQSPVDEPNQRIVTVGLNGVIGGQITGASQVGTGQAFNFKSSPTGSFIGFLNGGCQAIASVSASSPRVPFGLSNLIPKGQSGTLSITTGPAVGLLLSPFTGPFGGIRGLHYRSFTTSALTIPIFMPVC